jgi:ribosomal protein S18 acetylase RimI-like enzyme
MKIISCDFDNAVHCQALVHLLNAYKCDPMGGGAALNSQQQKDLIKGLSTHPSKIVLFAIYDDEFVGMMVGFINFSTFAAQKYINVHDLIVLKEYRHLGIGRKLLEEVLKIAQESGYCKVNLEVRVDNPNAQNLYKGLGFKDCVPPMLFWECKN